MNTTEALQILDSAAANAAGTRLDHVRIQEAVKVIAALIEASKRGVPSQDA